MCADICIHDTGGGNPHAHILLTMHLFEKGGAWGAKQKKEYILDQQGKKIYDPQKRQYKCNSVPATDWNEQTKAEEWRVAWADCVNTVLERGNYTERINHRSYKRQGIDKIPSVHIGVAATIKIGEPLPDILPSLQRGLTGDKKPDNSPETIRKICLSISMGVSREEKIKFKKGIG